ncbi:hypothetical protein GTO89_06110 [Heliobacterium gestii]|uniref:histidine kinase n=1 Tax=Heliomicrobium gestii TaxID=2699 RepID=A0A845LAL4_HELGE|nr:ATP-binding protein [Heliomicrobium gestii]MBM7866062.1 signal transduction histidine kinase [Heliomicrobium gestii]MZP42611.1 hypothetical protein [Heliomicrobium gestii]
MERIAIDTEETMPDRGSERYILLIVGFVFLLIVAAIMVPPMDKTRLKADLMVPLHLAMEGAGVVVSMFIFSTIWHTREKATTWLVYVGISFWIIGMVDALHLLSKPMLAVSSLYSAHVSAVFGCLSRLILAGAMLGGLFISPLNRLSLRESLLWLVAAATMLSVVALSLFTNIAHYPEQVNEERLRGFTDATMVTAVIGDLVTAWFYWRRGDEERRNQWKRIAAGLILSALSAAVIFLEDVVPGGFFFSSHFLKVISYAFFYQAIFIRQVKTPFEELARRRSEHRARMVAMMNASKDGIAFYTRKHGDWICNASFGEMFGSDEEVLTFDNTDLFYRAIQAKLDEPEKVAALLQNELQREEAERLGPWRIHVLSEPCRTVDLYLNPVEVERNIFGWLLLFCDVTKEIEFHRLRSEYFSAATHEIRTPLASIDGYIELALEPGVPVDERRHYLKQAKSNLSRLHQLVSNILDLEKLQASPPGHRFQPLDVETLIHAIADNYAILAARKGLQFQCEIAPALPPLCGDEIRLGQALSNLLSNAIKYTPDGCCGIHASRQGEQVRIEVRDTGIGLSEREMNQLFERFYRAENEVTRKTTGTGLGLSIVKTIVESHGGEITVASQWGRGTTFVILLPSMQRNQVEPAAL